MNRKNLTYGLLAILAVLAAFAAFGQPIIQPEALAGLGILPMAAGTTMGDLANTLEELGRRADEWRDKKGAEIDSLRETVEELAKKSGRLDLGGGGQETTATAAENWIDTKTRQSVPVLEAKQSLASFEKKAGTATPSVGRVLRGIILGSRADDAKELEEERKAMSIGTDPAGGFTVQGALAAEWVDLLRAEMVLNRAGARTVPMGSNSLTIARVTGDPTVSWHTENAALAASEPTLGAVTLTSRTVTCLVKMSLELAQDSGNIEQIVQGTLVSSMAQAIDRAGLVGITTDALAAPMNGTGIMNLNGRNSVTSIGAPTNWDFMVDGMYKLMADNVPMDRVGALVAHPALWKKLRKLKTGITSDNTPLTAPAEIAALPKLWTTAAPLTGGTTATGIIADWRDLLFGVRKDITVQVLREAYMGSNLQIAVLAYARVDFAATRPKSFCTLEGITV